MGGYIVSDGTRESDMGRPPIGKHALSGAERQRRYLAGLIARAAGDGAAKPAQPAKPDATAQALAQAQARVRELQAEVAALKAERLHIDPKTLAPSAQAKLEAAKRMMERKLNAEHAARMRNLNEEVRQCVLQEGKEYLATLQEMRDKVEADEKWYRTLINDHKPPFTVDQYKTILMCLHPDGERSPAKLKAAFILLEDKKEVLTGERQKKRII